jgi:hypothetical protein
MVIPTLSRAACLSAAAVAALVLLAAAPARGDVPYVGTPPETVERMLALAGVGPNDYVIDLGSGDGRIVIAAAKRFGARGLGVEISPVRVRESRRNAEAAGVAHLVEFREQNLFETDLSRATVLTMYLLNSVNLELRPRILEQLKPGTRVVSHAYAMGAWVPDHRSKGGGAFLDVYGWIVPARVAGDWDLRLPLSRTWERAYRIELVQDFQRVAGFARADGRTVVLDGVRLEGERIEFRLVDEVGGRAVSWYASGRVEGDRMSGRVRIEGDLEVLTDAREVPRETAWSAAREAPR